MAANFETTIASSVIMTKMRLCIITLIFSSIVNAINPIEVSGRKFIDSVTGKEVCF